MLRPRIIPCLLVHQEGLVKTVRYGQPKYVGDPVNAVRIFNEKEVDELVVLDIDASVEGRGPDMGMIEKLAAECRMPLCYGGGVKTVDQAKRIVRLGVEKIAVSSALFEESCLLDHMVAAIGSQSVVAVLDVRWRTWRGGHEICTHNGRRAVRKPLAGVLHDLQRAGVGEVVVNSIDRDGCMEGYDWRLLDAVKPGISVPMTALGGAGSLDDMRRLFERYGIVGAAAGSLFVFKGPYRAVLINYPGSEEKARLVAGCRTTPRPAGGSGR